jgi:hypothetical protein
MVAEPILATLNVVSLFVINTTAELSLTYENVPVLDETGDSVNDDGLNGRVWFTRPLTDGVLRRTVNEKVLVPLV